MITALVKICAKLTLKYFYLLLPSMLVVRSTYNFDNAPGAAQETVISVSIIFIAGGVMARGLTALVGDARRLWRKYKR